MALRIESPARRGLVLGGVMAAMFLAAMESTVVATAMPTVIASLGGIRIYSWAFSAFLLTSTVSMPIWGRLADHLGHRPSYLSGLALFMLGSALAGTSRSMEQLIVFRALQGLGAGSLITIGMTIVGDLYGMERRAKMQGYFSGVWGVASLVGPLVGGLLTDRVSWRWVFYINLPFGLLAAAAITAGLRDEGHDRPHASFDLQGMTVFAAAVSAFLLGLLEAGSGESWLRSPGMALLAAAGALLVLFVFVERRAAEPVIPLHLFRNPMVRAAAATGLLAGMAMFGAITYVPLYLQAVTGSTATQAGWVLMPFVLGWVVFSVLGARLVLRVGYRRVVLAGMVGLVSAFVLLSSWDESLTRAIAGRDIALAGVGMGLIFVPMLIAVQSAVPRALLGSATSLTAFFRTIGGTVGVALMGAAMTHRLERELAGLVATAPDNLREPLRWVAAHPDLVVNPITRGALGGDLLGQMRPALAHAVGGVFVVGLVIAVTALVSALLVPGGQARDLAAQREGASGSPSGS